MAKRVPAITQDELLAAIEEARMDFNEGVEEARPAGAFSAEEYIARYGGSHSRVRDNLRRLVKEGLYEELMTLGRDRLGRRYRLPVYRKVVKQVPNAKVDRVR